MTTPAKWAAGATAAAALAAAAFCIHLANGFFLSDDFVQLANFARWQESGRFWQEVLAFFGASIDGVNGFWRPLAFATFALNYAVAGAHAGGWLAVNLALHLANAVLVGALVERLAGVRAPRIRAAALFAGTLFFAFAPGWETAAWISGRYDTLSACFALLAGWWFAGGRTGWALAAAAMALMSKESGAGALVLVGCLAVARELERPWQGAGQAARRVALELWPFVLLSLAYAGLRMALFGSATQVYAGASVPVLEPGHWATMLAGLADWNRKNFVGPWGWRALATVATIVLLALGLAVGGRSRTTLARLLAALATSAATLLLVLRHVPSIDSTGVGGRLFYFPAAAFAVAMGLAAAALLSAGSGRPALRLATSVLIGVLVLSHLHWMSRMGREYRNAHREMRAVAAGVAQIAAASQGPVAVLFIPGTLGRIPFGRNAQAGLVLPPVQARAISDRVLVQIHDEIPDIPAKIERGVFDWLTRNNLFDFPVTGNARLPGAVAAEPSAYYCWSTRERRFMGMTPGTGERDSLARRIEHAYLAAGCRPTS